MAVVSVSVQDSIPLPTKWEMPTSQESLRTPIPRGVVTFSSSDPIATLSAGDETAYSVQCTMPGGFAYLPKVINLRFSSDDLVANFNLNAFGFYTRADGPVTFFWSLEGLLVIDSAVEANIVWQPLPVTPKLYLLPGEQLTLRAADMDAGGSTAGDMFYFIELYVFDIDQIDKWATNTPIPIISHTSF